MTMLLKAINLSFNAFEMIKAAADCLDCYQDEKLTSAQKAARIFANTLFFLGQGAQLGTRIIKNSSNCAKLITTTIADGTFVVREVAKVACKSEMTANDYLGLAGHIVFRVSHVTDEACTLIPEWAGIDHDMVQQAAQVANASSLLFINRQKLMETGSNAWKALNQMLHSKAMPINIEIRLKKNSNPVVDVPKEDFESYSEIKNAKSIADFLKIPTVVCCDPVLTKYCCPITKKPIRFVLAVKDPAHGDRLVRYEREAISDLLKTSHAAPPSWPQGVPCSQEQLFEDRQSQAIIDQQLSALLTGFKELKIEKHTENTDDSIAFARNSHLDEMDEMIEREYPLKLVQLFRNCNMSIARLPMLNLGNRMGHTGYIDFIQLAEMNKAVIRFKDCYERSGIALHIQARALRKGQLIESVLVIFRRYADPESRWAHGWGNQDSRIEAMYMDIHDKTNHVGSRIIACPTCPFQDEDDCGTNIIFRNLLTDQDPDFFLPGLHSALA